jgi:hypothetical protein
MTRQPPATRRPPAATRAAAAEAAAHAEAAADVEAAAEFDLGGYGLVPARRLLEPSPIARFALGPGDRILVAPGDVVAPGTGLAERRRDPRKADGPPVTGAIVAEHPLRPGDWWPGNGRETAGPLRRSRPRTPAGELLHPSGHRWRIASGDHVDLLEAPAAGTVREATAGRGIALALGGLALRGAMASGTPTRGRFERVTGESGLRGALDVGRAGAILVVDGRTESEALIRARAMGVRGVVVPGLSGKDLRDLLASEARQRASLQPLTSFAVLVLDGTSRRPIAGPVAALLAALEGREVAIVVDPPLLVFDPPARELPPLPPDWVRIRAGELAGREGRWLRTAGIRRFAAGVHLEAAAIALDDGEVVFLPIADLERFI